MIVRRITISLILVVCIICKPLQAQSSLDGMVIILDPGHGGTAETDMYRVGPGGEREEWINLRVALKLENLLKEEGAIPYLTRREDVEVPLQERAEVAVDKRADLFISIHHNATADPDVNFPIVYYHGYASDNEASVELGRSLICHLNESMFDGEAPVSLVSDRTIFPNAGTAVLRHSYGIPGVITEASFFTNPDEEKRLMDRSYNDLQAHALLEGIKSYAEKITDTEPTIRLTDPDAEIPPFRVFQEEERMSEEALKWNENYERGKAHYYTGESERLEDAYELFSQSIRAFADSPVAGSAHRYRARILEKKGLSDQAAVEYIRVDEFYPFSGGTCE